jgi:hypothetical protein
LRSGRRARSVSNVPQVLGTWPDCHPVAKGRLPVRRRSTLAQPVNDENWNMSALAIPQPTALETARPRMGQGSGKIQECVGPR